MAIHYREGEHKTRPGLYLRFVNRGQDRVAQEPYTPPPAPPEEPDEITVSYDGSGLVTLSIPGCTVSHDGNGNVLLSGLTVPVTNDGNGIITIGGT